MFVDREKYVSFKNETGEEIPPFGCVIIEGASVEDREIVFSVRKCTEEDADLQEPESVLFNNVQPVPDGEYGVGTRDFPTQALIEDDTLTPGTPVGPKFGTFVLSDAGSCFRVLAKDTTDPHIVSGSAVYFIEARHGNTDFWLGKLDAVTSIPGRVGDDLAGGAVTLYKLDDSGVMYPVGGTSVPKIVTAFNPGTDPILVNSRVLVWRVGNKYVCIGVCN